MSSPTSSVAIRAMDAAFLLFARHGFKRTSLADVAREAGVSRAALYLNFRDKPALYAAMSLRLVDEALAESGAAWDETRDLAGNIEAMVLAKDLRFCRLLHETPHGKELLAVDEALTSAEAARMNTGFAAIMSERVAALEAAGQADLSAFGGAKGFGENVTVIAFGLKHEVQDEAAYRAAVARLSQIIARAAAPGPST